MILTKATVIYWSVDPFANELLNTDRSAKLQQMQQEGKTDLSFQEVNPTIYKRFWIDIAAAQEYIDFMMGLSNIYGPGLITSTEIVDVNVTI